MFATPEIIHGDPMMLLFAVTCGIVVTFLFYVNWDVFCNFSKNGRSVMTHVSIVQSLTLTPVTYESNFISLFNQYNGKSSAYVQL